MVVSARVIGSAGSSSAASTAVMPTQADHVDRPVRLGGIDWRGADPPSQVLQRPHGSGERRLRQHNQKFVAAIPAGDVARAQPFLQHATDHRERAVSDGMAVRVVQLLEVVEVENRDA